MILARSLSTSVRRWCRLDGPDGLDGLGREATDSRVWDVSKQFGFSYRATDALPPTFFWPSCAYSFLSSLNLVERFWYSSPSRDFSVVLQTRYSTTTAQSRRIYHPTDRRTIQSTSPRIRTVYIALSIRNARTAPVRQVIISVAAGKR
nr:hypothetical protein CFP56_24392 [Quercus suber]